MNTLQMHSVQQVLSFPATDNLSHTLYYSLDWIVDACFLAGGKKI